MGRSSVTMDERPRSPKRLIRNEAKILNKLPLLTVVPAKRACEGIPASLVESPPRRKPGSIVPPHEPDIVGKPWIAREFEAPGPWVPAFAGKTMGILRIRTSIPHFFTGLKAEIQGAARPQPLLQARACPWRKQGAGTGPRFRGGDDNPLSRPTSFLSQAVKSKRADPARSRQPPRPPVACWGR